MQADLVAVTAVYRSASLSNAGDRDNMLAHPEYLIMGPEGLTEGRTHVAEEDGAVVGFATWAATDGVVELEDLFVDPRGCGAESPPRWSVGSWRFSVGRARNAWK